MLAILNKKLEELWIKGLKERRILGEEQDKGVREDWTDQSYLQHLEMSPLIVCNSE